MTQVSANATGNPFQSSSGEPDGSTVTSLAPVRLLVALISVAAGLSLALALRAPLATTVLGLIAFGVLHNVLEIRYVAGRFAGLLTGRFLGLLLVLTTGIALCRLAAAAWPQGARAAEIVVALVEGGLIFAVVRRRGPYPETWFNRLAWSIMVAVGVNTLSLLVGLVLMPLITGQTAAVA